MYSIYTALGAFTPLVKVRTEEEAIAICKNHPNWFYVASI